MGEVGEVGAEGQKRRAERRAVGPARGAWLSLGALCLACSGAPPGQRDQAPASAPVPPAPVVLEYATANPAQSAHARHIDKFAELVRRYSNGRVELRVHLDGVKGSEQENVMDVSAGKLDMTTVAVNNVTSFAPAVGFMTLPYFFPDAQRARPMFLAPNPVIQRVQAAMIREGNFRALGWLNSGFRVLTNSKRPVRHPDDLKGLRIRVPENPIMVAAYRAWGIEPIPLPWTSVYDALESGTIDGQDNPYHSDVFMPGARKPFYEIQRYITDIHYILLILVHIINEDTYQGLPPELRRAVDRAARESTACEWDWVQGENLRLRELLLRRGMQLIEPADGEAPWRAAARSVWPQFYDRIGGEAFVKQAAQLLEAPAEAQGEQARCSAPIAPAPAQPGEAAAGAPQETLVLGGAIRCPYLCDPETGQPGFLMEIARAAFEPKGYRVRYAPLPWSRALQRVRSGELAGLIGAQRRSAAELVFPVEAQGRTRMRFFVRPGSSWRYRGLVSLREVKLGVIQDFSYGELDSYVRKHVGTDTVQALAGSNPLLRNVKKLRMGRISAIVEDEVVMRHVLATHKLSEAVTSAGALFDENVYIAFSPSHPGARHYAELLSEATASLRASGRLARILARYGLKDWR